MTEYTTQGGVYYNPAHMRFYAHDSRGQMIGFLDKEVIVRTQGVPLQNLPYKYRWLFSSVRSYLAGILAA